MKAPSFDYARPASLDEVFALLRAHGDDARLLAGGQTLLATLNMRLSEPAHPKRHRHDRRPGEEYARPYFLSLGRRSGAAHYQHH